MSVRRLAVIVAFCAVLAPGLAGAVEVKPLAIWKGVDVWFAPDKTLPMLSVAVSLPAGSAYDPAGKEGLASYAANLLDEGAGEMDSTAFHAALNDHAIQLGVDTDRDYTIVTLTALSENAKEAFGLLGLALTRPRFDPATAARVRGQIVAALQQDEEDPSSVAAKAFFTAFFRGHPYGHPVNGTVEGLANVSPQDLKKFAQTHWVRGGMKIAISGNIDPAALKALLVSTFGKLPEQPPAYLPPVQHMGKPGVSVVAMPVPQPNAVFGLPGLVRSDRDFIPAYVANYILGGGGFSSRLTTEVREKRGLTYGVSTAFVPYRKAGVFIGEVASKRESIRQAVQVIRDTMQAFVNQGPTDAELADAKTYLTGSFPLAFDSNTGIAAQLSAFQRAGLGVDYLKKRNDLINAVTADDVRRVSKRLFNASKLTVVVAGSFGPDAKPPARAAPVPAAQGSKPPNKPAPKMPHR